jgi:membrane protein involved in colicin uptake
VTEEEKAAADKLKQERQREAAKEKLRAMKEKKRIERAEKAAREAAGAAEQEAARAAEEAAAAAQPNDFLNSLMGDDDPEPEPAESSESEEVRCPRAVGVEATRFCRVNSFPAGLLWFRRTNS